MAKTIDRAEFEKRFNEIRPDYALQFGTDFMGLGCELDSFTVEKDGKTTLKVTETYLNNQYAIKYREHTRHPKLTPDEIKYLLQEEK